MKGKLQLTIAKEKHLLEAGDAIYFDPALPHAYSRASQHPCEALIVTSL
jgi:quercetin dioxygenase-like cupin family protein